MNEVSQRVQSLYEKYPYPPKEMGECIDPHLDYIINFSAKKRSHKPSFLDAGCGTGSSTIGAALINKDWQVYACDFNQKALDQIDAEAQELGITNLETRQVDLLDFPEDWGPEGGFDVIFCAGVIHHTPEPLKVLKSLASRLAPQGVLQLMVYAERGREPLYEFKECLQGLFSNAEGSLEEKLKVGRSLLAELHQAGEGQGYPVKALRGPLADSHSISDEEFADRYLNPYDKPYTLDKLKEHIENSGLSLLRWFEQRTWDLEELLPSLKEKTELPADPWARYALIEELFDRPKYDLYLVGPNFQRPVEPLSWDCPLKLNPQVYVTEKMLRGHALDYRVQLLDYPEEWATLRQGKLLKALSKRSASLRELLAEWGEEESEEWFMETAYLFYRDMIYRPTWKCVGS